MSPRQAESDKTGRAGETEVRGAFERLGWAVIENPRHDRGTDQFVSAHSRGFDLGNLVGVQVKTGPSYFNEPFSEDGVLGGWWSRDDDREHIDAWLKHGFPHLIVLCDLDARKCYWAHVTPDSVVPAGKGAKIPVRIEDTIDADHEDALLAVAATPRPRVLVEGTAWTGLRDLLPRDALRHALIVPRLVAPHPNLGHARPITAAQAAALVVQARVGDLRRFAADYAEVPSLAEAATSGDWEWRFVAALAQFTTGKGLDGLRDTIRTATTTASRAAAVVAVAAALIEDEQADEAVRLLEEHLARDDAHPVDHAWLTVQHARACAELGRLQATRDDALAVQTIRVTSPEDVTGSAIASAAARLLFNTGSWQQQSLEDVITGTDTAADWWQTQMVSWALFPLTTRTFRAWSRDTATIIGGENDVHNRLVAAARVASNTGNQGDWQAAARLIAVDDLIQVNRHGTPASVQETIELLRLSGDQDAMLLAVKRLIADGPIAAVKAAAEAVDTSKITRTTARTTLTLLQRAGDLFDSSTASATAEWLLRQLDDPSSFIERTSTPYLVPSRILETLSGIIAAADRNTQRKVIERVAALEPQTDDVNAANWAEVVGALPDEAITVQTAALLASNADSHHLRLRYAILRKSSLRDPDSQATLLSEAAKGSVYAFEHLNDVRELSTSGAAAIVNKLSDAVRQTIEQARNSSWSIGGDRNSRGLVIANRWHSTVASWEPIIEVLSEPMVDASTKRLTMSTLARVTEEIPEDVKRVLVPVVSTMLDTTTPSAPPFPDEDNDVTGPATELAVALGALSESSATPHLAELLRGDSGRRSWAAGVCGRLATTQSIGVLLPLSQDEHHDVRAAAAGVLAYLVATGRGNEPALVALRTCVEDSGRMVPATIAKVLSDTQPRSEAANGILRSLADHPSAHVRHAASAA